MYQYHRDKLDTNNNAFVGFADNNTTDSFEFKERTTDPTGSNGTKNDEMMVPYQPALDNNNNNNAIVDFVNNNTTDSFKFKEKITGQTSKNRTKNVKIMVLSKYLSNF